MDGKRFLGRQNTTAILLEPKGAEIITVHDDERSKVTTLPTPLFLSLQTNTLDGLVLDLLSRNAFDTSDDLILVVDPRLYSENPLQNPEGWAEKDFDMQQLVTRRYRDVNVRPSSIEDEVVGKLHVMDEALQGSAKQLRKIFSEYRLHVRKLYHTPTIMADVWQRVGGTAQNRAVLHVGKHSTWFVCGRNGQEPSYQGVSTLGADSLISRLPGNRAEQLKIIAAELCFLPEFVPEADRVVNYQRVKPAFGTLVKDSFAWTEGYCAKFREFKVDTVLLQGEILRFPHVEVALAGHANSDVERYDSSGEFPTAPSIWHHHIGLPLYALMAYQENLPDILQRGRRAQLKDFVQRLKPQRGIRELLQFSKPTLPTPGYIVIEGETSIVVHRIHADSMSPGTSHVDFYRNHKEVATVYNPRAVHKVEDIAKDVSTYTKGARVVFEKLA